MKKVARISKEFKLGVIVVVGVVLLIIGVNYLRGFNPFQEAHRYYAVYEKIDGLSVSNPVLVNGFKVGQVTSVQFSERGDGSLIVAFDLQETALKLPIDSKAKIISSDLFGTKAIDLIAGQSPDLATAGDTLASDIEVGIAEAVRIELMPLKNKTSELIDGVDEILENLKAVFESDATTQLPAAFESLQRTVRTLEHTSTQLDGMVTENRGNLRSMLSNADAITANLRNHNEALANVIQNFSQISDSLAAIQFASTMAKADKTLGEFAAIAEKINRGEGTIGALIQSDSLHNGLVQTNRELQLLLNDLYLNPGRYVSVSVFSKKEDKKMSQKEIERLRGLIDEQLEEREGSSGAPASRDVPQP